MELAELLGLLLMVRNIVFISSSVILVAVLAVGLITKSYMEPRFFYGIITLCPGLLCLNSLWWMYIIQIRSCIKSSIDIPYELHVGAILIFIMGIFLSIMGFICLGGIKGENKS